MITTRFRGLDIFFNGNNWIDKNGEIIKDEQVCCKCKKSPTLEGHDSCLGTLKGVKNACCGHGHIEDTYVQFDNDKVLRGVEALKYFESVK